MQIHILKSNMLTAGHNILGKIKIERKMSRVRVSCTDNVNFTCGSCHHPPLPSQCKGWSNHWLFPADHVTRLRHLPQSRNGGVWEKKANTSHWPIQPQRLNAGFVIKDFKNWRRKKWWLITAEFFASLVALSYLVNLPVVLYQYSVLCGIKGSAICLEFQRNKTEIWYYFRA